MIIGRRKLQRVGLMVTVGLSMVGLAFGQTPSGRTRQFPPGSVQRVEDLPPGRFRERLVDLSTTARRQALDRLRDFHFTEMDLDSLHADASGGVFYADTFNLAVAPAVSGGEPVISAAAVPVSPFPTTSVFHSHPGSPNVLFLNFGGETITNGQWLIDVGRSSIPAVAFSTDGDYANFSDAEQLAIKRIWQRVAEDYAPFDIDVTTERPANFTTRTAHALITRNTDANGDPNPSSTAGGVAYVNVFAMSSYASYRPAWIYINNLANDESYIAEAASHEIGHNLGLSHDGRTDGLEYYGGHGSGDTSWGPLMGTGYNRNVSQWCQGEYYLANNTEDDLAIISGKINYRPDDHGNTAVTATPLLLAGLTNILSTTPETDPNNTNPANKGVLERNTDVDVFSFITGDGPMSLAIKPGSMPPGITRGGNLDLSVELRDGSGRLLLTNNPANQTTATLQTNLTEGVYFLHIRNTGVGDPFSASPTGYTTYGSLGQYFISGYLVPSTLIAPPLAEAHLSDITQTGSGANAFSVTYADNLAIAVATIDNTDIRITGPNGYDHAAQFGTVDNLLNGSPRVATYSAPPAVGGTWTATNNGTYSVWMQANQVSDTEGANVAPGLLGQFQVLVPSVVYAANMDTDPGWALNGQWQYGVPAYTGSNAPTGGFTGTKILAYNLSGNYGNNLTVTYATTPAIDCSSFSGISLRFRRWLRLRSQDTALIQFSTNGTVWTDVWSTTRAVTDSNWQDLQYPLPAAATGANALRLRWGIGSGASLNDIGWNIDDVEILAAGTLDTAPPTALLAVTNLTSNGATEHPFTVNYTDATSVSVASLGAGDLLVTGPNNYSNRVEFLCVDVPQDGTPRIATYAIPAPAGLWNAADNGSYQISLRAGEVWDGFSNAAPQTILGTFNVAIPTNLQAILVNTTALSVPEGGNAGFAIRLAAAPASNLAVSITRVSGDTDLVVLSGATNVFTSANWSNPVPVMIAALTDPDQQSGVATLSCAAAGLTPVLVIATEQDNTPNANLITSVNVPGWGNVVPVNTNYPVGTVVQITANPAPYFGFAQWSGAASGTINPLTLVINSNLSVQAVFSEILTTNHPTPLWWLAAHGVAGNYESAVAAIGANGLALWQSYIAGLDPNNPADQLRLSLNLSETNLLLHWNTVTGRVYTLWESTNVLGGFTPLTAGTSMPPTIQQLTLPAPLDAAATWYRLQVQKP